MSKINKESIKKINKENRKNRISNNWKLSKLFDSYKKLSDSDKIRFVNKINPEIIDISIENELQKLEMMQIRANVAQTLMNVVREDGFPFLNVDWVAKNVMKLSDKDIAENKLISKEISKARKTTPPARETNG